MNLQKYKEFENLIRKYGDNLYAIALLHTKNKADAQDIIQEVFLKYAKGPQTFKSQEHEKAWFIRVTINMCINLSRSAWSTKTTELSDESMPYEEFRTSENDVYQAVMKLPAKYRDVIHLYYFEGYSIKEIGVLTRQKDNTVKTQLARARDLLKNVLKGEYDYAV
ncbi:MAG: sigma-70 family RNA polymerase sigma factor [Oscillospiraceae bacterium]|nr:sigma-70 family RNA polymerase sigma factor [Oscillospiraceae bacterium]